MRYIIGTILFTVYGQLVIKWQTAKAGAFPAGMSQRVSFFASLIFNPWVLSGMAAAFLAALLWMTAMTKLELSYAYPLFVSSTIVLVLMLSGLFFREAMTAPKVIGTVVILVGMIIASRG